jgi:hypothetical protein
MIAETQINEHLSKTKCYKCGASLGGARLTPISKVPVALIAYAVCPNCLTESIVTITLAEGGIMPIASDLKSSEMQKFIGRTPTSYDELLELHKKLKRKPIWKLLQQNEKNLEKSQKASENKGKSQP